MNLFSKYTGALTFRNFSPGCRAAGICSVGAFLCRRAGGSAGGWPSCRRRAAGRRVRCGCGRQKRHAHAQTAQIRKSPVDSDLESLMYQGTDFPKFIPRAPQPTPSWAMGGVCLCHVRMRVSCRWPAPLCKHRTLFCNFFFKFLFFIFIFLFVSAPHPSPASASCVLHARTRARAHTHTVGLGMQGLEFQF